MLNMFSGNREKQIPKTFNDCYKTDKVTNNLWLWAERLETIGIVLAIIVGIAGFIIGLVLFETSDGGSLLISFLGAPIVAFLEYISFHIFALLIGSLASIVQHTRINADLSLYKFATDNDIPTSNTKLTNGVTLSTDHSNDKLAKILTNNESNVSNRNSHVWRCEKCNNLISAYPCVHCGHKKT